jgi:hypothetical protein
MHSRRRPLLFLAALAGLLTLTAGCPKKDGGGGGGSTVPRCEVDLAATGLFAMEGSGASAARLEEGAPAIGGEGAQARPGDVLLQNDKIRVVIEQPGRSVGPLLSGGHIIDADVVRPESEPGRDVFGRLGLIYALGRLTSVSQVEVVSDGASGGPAVVASTGRDVQHDLLNLNALLINAAGLSVEFVVDGNKPVPVRSTTYYVLSPGESRVRVLTAFCNEGDTPVQLPMVELMDVGAFGVFNPGGCANGLGTADVKDTSCLLEPSAWVGTQGNGVAYGLRNQSLEDLAVPMGRHNASLGYGGVLGTFVGGESVNGVLSWADAEARTRPGSFAIRGGAQRSYLRDFVVARDLGGITEALWTADGAALGTVQVTGLLPGGAAAARARVSIADAAGVMTTLIELDAAGKGSVRLPAGTWKLTGALEGRLPGPAVEVTVAAGATQLASVQLEPSRRLTVQVKDPFGRPGPAKVFVRCAGGTCPFSFETWRQHYLFEKFSNGAAAIGFVPVQGTLDLWLPPGMYDVTVSRGPEFNVWPDTWPQAGHPVDLTQLDAQVDAVLARVVETPGWMSADLHVHAAASADSAVPNELRVLSFLGEGVDVLLSTDHEHITDFAPYIRALGAEGLMASMIGEEVTTFSYGHFNAFPLVRKAEVPNGGAFDHAGGEASPSLRLTELFPAIKAEHDGAVVQINHPRGGGGALTLLKVDTATGASHGVPADYGMAPDPDATAADTRVYGEGFDALETANGPSPSSAVLNDWMTLLSRGAVRTASGTSDTHYAYKSTGGYARTYAQVGADTPAGFSARAFADAIRTQRAYVTNGPLLEVTARRLDAGGQPVGAPVELGGTISIGAGESLELTVDVQAAETTPFDRIELHSHAPGREAQNGESNSTWPDGRILQTRTLDPANLPLEPVAGTNGVPLRRVHVTEKFVVQPTTDTWLVVMVRGRATRALWPLHGSQAMAYSNAILVDADGSGRYDDFPLKPGMPLRAPRPATKAKAKVPTAAELQQAIGKLLDHDHE